MPEANSSSNVTLPGGVTSNNVVLDEELLQALLQGGTVTAGDGSAINNNTYYQPVNAVQNFARPVSNGGGSVSGRAIDSPALLPAPAVKALPNLPQMKQMQPMQAHSFGLLSQPELPVIETPDPVKLQAMTPMMDGVTPKKQRNIDRILGAPKTPEEMAYDVNEFLANNKKAQSQPQPQQRPLPPQAQPQRSGMPVVPFTTAATNPAAAGYMNPLEAAAMNSVQPRNRSMLGKMIHSAAGALNPNVAAKHAANSKARADVLTKILNNQNDRILKAYEYYKDLETHAMDNRSKEKIQRMKDAHVGALTRSQAVNALKTAQAMSDGPARELVLDQVAGVLGEQAISGLRHKTPGKVASADKKEKLDIKKKELDIKREEQKQAPGGTNEVEDARGKLALKREQKDTQIELNPEVIKADVAGRVARNNNAINQGVKIAQEAQEFVDPNTVAARVQKNRLQGEIARSKLEGQQNTNNAFPAQQARNNMFATNAGIMANLIAQEIKKNGGEDYTGIIQDSFKRMQSQLNQPVQQGGPTPPPGTVAGAITDNTGPSGNIGKPKLETPPPVTNRIGESKPKTTASNPMMDVFKARGYKPNKTKKVKIISDRTFVQELQKAAGGSTNKVRNFLADNGYKFQLRKTASTKKGASDAFNVSRLFGTAPGVVTPYWNYMK